jgi:hypothetical protein
MSSQLVNCALTDIIWFSFESRLIFSHNTEGVRSCLGKNVKITLQALVKMETKGDKTDNRVLVRYLPPEHKFVLNLKVVLTLFLCHFLGSVCLSPVRSHCEGSYSSKCCALLFILFLLTFVKMFSFLYSFVLADRLPLSLPRDPGYREQEAEFCKYIRLKTNLIERSYRDKNHVTESKATLLNVLL